MTAHLVQNSWIDFLPFLNLFLFILNILKDIALIVIAVFVFKIYKKISTQDS